MSQVMVALDEAHAHGVIDRDLKPSNIMLIERRGEKDFVKVCDFGIAKATTRDGKDDDWEQMLTIQGLVCGTPEYMSPEQARAEPLDGRADLYSAAIILYQLVTGDIPFRAESPMGIVSRHLAEVPRAPSLRRPDLPIPKVDGRARSCAAWRRTASCAIRPPWRSARRSRRSWAARPGSSRRSPAIQAAMPTTPAMRRRPGATAMIPPVPGGRPVRHDGGSDLEGASAPGAPRRDVAVLAARPLRRRGVRAALHVSDRGAAATPEAPRRCPSSRPPCPPPAARGRGRPRRRRATRAPSAVLAAAPVPASGPSPRSQPASPRRRAHGRPPPPPSRRPRPAARPAAAATASAGPPPEAAPPARGAREVLGEAEKLLSPGRGRRRLRPRRRGQAPQPEAGRHLQVPRQVLHAGRPRAQANENYQKYLELAPNASDAPFIKSMLK